MALRGARDQLREVAPERAPDEPDRDPAAKPAAGDAGPLAQALGGGERVARIGQEHRPRLGQLRLARGADEQLDAERVLEAPGPGG